MKEIILDSRYVLHVPLSKCVNGNLLPLDIDDILDDLTSSLGVDGYYTVKVKSSYKSRIYDELLIVIFAGNDSIVETFKRWFIKNNDVLGQEAFAFEVDNEMHIISLDDD